VRAFAIIGKDDFRARADSPMQSSRTWRSWHNTTKPLARECGRYSPKVRFCMSSGHIESLCPAELHQVALSFAIRLDNKRAASPPQSPKPPFF